MEEKDPTFVFCSGFKNEIKLWKIIYFLKKLLIKSQLKVEFILFQFHSLKIVLQISQKLS